MLSPGAGWGGGSRETCKREQREMRKSSLNPWHLPSSLNITNAGFMYWAFSLHQALCVTPSPCSEPLGGCLLVFE